GLNSGTTTNAYDFVAYSNEIVSILIVIFSILIASKLIAGEQSNGTMKLLAIRPYSRTKIIFGKLFATIFFAAIFMLFATICNLLIGIGFFGLPATSLMIGVFNGTSVFVSHPIVFLIFSTFSIFLKIIMFTSIAVLISVLFKSYTGAAFSSFIIYILTFGLNFLLKGTSWYKFFPTANFDLYKYFIPLQQTADPTLANIIYPLFNDANFFLTLGIFLGTLLIIQLISIITFKRKDIA
ncbi:MAG: ABC transporter permease subunit, partial [Clostridia bacterium]